MGPSCVFVKADVMVEDEVAAVIEKAIDLWGKCVPNSAATSPLDTTRDSFFTWSGSLCVWAHGQCRAGGLKGADPEG
eukprot:SAG11_NODE_28829_length_317_cov_1.165138_1_plen_76_part_01